VSEIDYPEEFTPIAAGLSRLPYLSPSAKFADRVMSRVRIQGSDAPAPAVAQPRLAVIRGGAPRHLPDSALVKMRRRRLMQVAVGVPASVGMLIAVSVIFTQLDVLSVFLSAAAAGFAPAMGIVGTTAGGYYLGSDVMAAMQTGSAQAALIYMVMVLGLISGYAGIKVSAEIAKRKAA
jgi:hypothetical protein